MWERDLIPIMKWLGKEDQPKNRLILLEPQQYTKPTESREDLPLSASGPISLATPSFDAL